MSNSTPRPLQILNIVSALMAVIALGMVFLYAPREVSMGEVQRVFYFHVSVAWIGGLALFVGLVAGSLVLSKGQGNLRMLIAVAIPNLVIATVAWNIFQNTDIALWQYIAGATGSIGIYMASLAGGVWMCQTAAFWDRMEVSTVEVGLVFSFMTLFTGMIWGRPAWNTWWTWDPRTTTFAILILIYFAYFMLRQSLEDPDQRARFAAVYAIVGFVSVPITFFAIRLWRTIHPVVIGSSDPSAQGSFNMVAPMTHTLLFSLAFFTVLYVTLLWHRVRLAEAEQHIEELKAQVASA